MMRRSNAFLIILLLLAQPFVGTVEAQGCPTPDVIRATLQKQIEVARQEGATNAQIYNELRTALTTLANDPSTHPDMVQMTEIALPMLETLLPAVPASVTPSIPADPRSLERYRAMAASRNIDPAALQASIAKAQAALATEAGLAADTTGAIDTNGIVTIKNPNLPTLVIPDLHARRGMLVDALQQIEPISGKTYFELLKQVPSGVNVIMLGDIIHSEDRGADRWADAEKGNEESLNAEMVESLVALQMVMDLKATFPDNFHVIQGNHDDVTETYGGAAKFVSVSAGGESALLRRHIEAKLGTQTLEALGTVVRSFPLVVVGGTFAVSHTTPDIQRSTYDIQNKDYDAVKAMTQTDNTLASERDAQTKAQKQQRIANAVNSLLEEIRQETGRDVRHLIIGHRPVTDGTFRLDAGGNVVQINSQESMVVAAIPVAGFDPAQVTNIGPSEPAIDPVSNEELLATAEPAPVVAVSAVDARIEQIRRDFGITTADIVEGIETDANGVVVMNEQVYDGIVALGMATPEVAQAVQKELDNENACKFGSPMKCPRGKSGKPADEAKVENALDKTVKKNLRERVSPPVPPKSGVIRTMGTLGFIALSPALAVIDIGVTMYQARSILGRTPGIIEGIGIWWTKRTSGATTAEAIRGTVPPAPIPRPARPPVRPSTFEQKMGVLDNELAPAISGKLSDARALWETDPTFNDLIDAKLELDVVRKLGSKKPREIARLLALEQARNEVLAAQPGLSDAAALAEVMRMTQQGSTRRPRLLEAYLSISRNPARARREYAKILLTRETLRAGRVPSLTDQAPPSPTPVIEAEEVNDAIQAVLTQSDFVLLPPGSSTEQERVVFDNIAALEEEIQSVNQRAGKDLPPLIEDFTTVWGKPLRQYYVLIDTAGRILSVTSTPSDDAAVLDVDADTGMIHSIVLPPSASRAQEKSLAALAAIHNDKAERQLQPILLSENTRHIRDLFSLTTPMVVPRANGASIFAGGTSLDIQFGTSQRTTMGNFDVAYDAATGKLRIIQDTDARTVVAEFDVITRADGTTALAQQGTTTPLITDHVYEITENFLAQPPAPALIILPAAISTQGGIIHIGELALQEGQRVEDDHFIYQHKGASIDIIPKDATQPRRQATILRDTQGRLLGVTAARTILPGQEEPSPIMVVNGAVTINGQAIDASNPQVQDDFFTYTLTPNGISVTRIDGTQAGFDIPVYRNSKGVIIGIGWTQAHSEVQPTPVVLREGKLIVNGQPLTQAYVLAAARAENGNFNYVLIGDVLKITSKDGTTPEFTQKIVRNKDGSILALGPPVVQTGPTQPAILDLVLDGNVVSMTREEAVARYRAALELRTVPKEFDRSAAQISSHERWRMQEAALVAEREVQARLAAASTEEKMDLNRRLAEIQSMQREFINAEADRLVPAQVKKKRPGELPAQTQARIDAWKKQVTLENVRATAQPSVDLRTLEQTPGVVVTKTFDANGAMTALTITMPDGTKVELSQWLQQLSGMGGGDHVRIVAMKNAAGNDILSIQYGDISGHGLDAGILSALYKQIENEATRRVFQSLTPEQKAQVRRYIGQNLGRHGVNPTIDLDTTIDDNTAQVLEIAIAGSNVLAGTYDASVESGARYLQLRNALFPVYDSSKRYAAALAIFQRFPEHQDAIRAKISALPYNPEGGMTETQKEIYAALKADLISINPDTLTQDEFTRLNAQLKTKATTLAEMIERIKKAQAAQADNIERHTTQSAIIEALGNDVLSIGPDGPSAEQRQRVKDKLSQLQIPVPADAELDARVNILAAQTVEQAIIDAGFLAVTDTVQRTSRDEFLRRKFDAMRDGDQMGLYLGKFISGATIDVNMQQGTATLHNHGYEVGWVSGTDGQYDPTVVPPGQVLGNSPGANMEVGFGTVFVPSRPLKTTIRLDNGDAILIRGDGVTDATDIVNRRRADNNIPPVQRFDEALQEAAKQNKQLSPQEIVDLQQKKVQEANQELGIEENGQLVREMVDDMTGLSVKLTRASKTPPVQPLVVARSTTTEVAITAETVDVAAMVAEQADKPATPPAELVRDVHTTETTAVDLPVNTPTDASQQVPPPAPLVPSAARSSEQSLSSGQPTWGSQATTVPVEDLATGLDLIIAQKVEPLGTTVDVETAGETAPVGGRTGVSAARVVVNLNPGAAVTEDALIQAYGEQEVRRQIYNAFPNAPIIDIDVEIIQLTSTQYVVNVRVFKGQQRATAEQLGISDPTPAVSASITSPAQPAVPQPLRTGTIHTAQIVGPQGILAQQVRVIDEIQVRGRSNDLVPYFRSLDGVTGYPIVQIGDKLFIAKPATTAALLADPRAPELFDTTDPSAERAAFGTAALTDLGFNPPQVIVGTINGERFEFVEYDAAFETLDQLTPGQMREIAPDVILKMYEALGARVALGDSDVRLDNWIVRRENGKVTAIVPVDLARSLGHLRSPSPSFPSAGSPAVLAMAAGLLNAGQVTNVNGDDILQAMQRGINAVHDAILTPGTVERWAAAAGLEVEGLRAALEQVTSSPQETLAHLAAYILDDNFYAPGPSTNLASGLRATLDAEGTGITDPVTVEKERLGLGAAIIEANVVSNTDGTARVSEEFQDIVQDATGVSPESLADKIQAELRKDDDDAACKVGSDMKCSAPEGPVERAAATVVNNIVSDLLKRGLPEVTNRAEYEEALRIFTEQLTTYDIAVQKQRSKRPLTEEEKSALDTKELQELAELRSILIARHPHYHTLVSATPGSATYAHLEAHLKGTEVGSVFSGGPTMAFQSAQDIIDFSEQVLAELYTTGTLPTIPGWTLKVIAGTPPGGRVVIEATADKQVGVDALIPITPENQDTVTRVRRTQGGRDQEVNIVPGDKQPTSTMHIIGGRYGPTSSFGLYTIFPGGYAPSFGPNEDPILRMTGDQFWAQHAFIAEVKERTITDAKASEIIKEDSPLVTTIAPPRPSPPASLENLVNQGVLDLAVIQETQPGKAAFEAAMIDKQKITEFVANTPDFPGLDFTTGTIKRAQEKYVFGRYGEVVKEDDAFVTVLTTNADGKLQRITFSKKNNIVINTPDSLEDIINTISTPDDLVKLKAAIQYKGYVGRDLPAGISDADIMRLYQRCPGCFEPINPDPNLKMSKTAVKGELGFRVIVEKGVVTLGDGFGYRHLLKHNPEFEGSIDVAFEQTSTKKTVEIPSRDAFALLFRHNDKKIGVEIKKSGPEGEIISMYTGFEEGTHKVFQRDREQEKSILRTLEGAATGVTSTKQPNARIFVSKDGSRMVVQYAGASASLIYEKKGTAVTVTGVPGDKASIEGLDEASKSQKDKLFSESIDEATGTYKKGFKAGIKPNDISVDISQLVGES